MNAVIVLGAGAIIDLDASFIVQLVIFLALYAALNALVFQPMLKLYERRRRETEGNEEESREALEKAEALEASYETVVSKAEARGIDQRNKQRDVALHEEAQVLSESREKSAKWFETELSRHAAEVDQLRKDAEPVMKKLADEIVIGLTK